MRLTVDLIKASLTYLNPLKERELDLRGHRIPTIENLGAAGPLDSIDLTDNDIQLLGNFPLSPRISTLLLARNRISRIHPTIAASIPNLKNLVLSSNNFGELADLDTLGKFNRLTHLTLQDNPVEKKEHYRHWIIWRCPSVRFLDFKKVKQEERERAEELFGMTDGPTKLAKEIMGTKSTAVESSAQDDGVPTSKLSRMKLTDKEKKRLQDMIKTATSLQEIIKLEAMLNEGKLPPGFQVGGDEMEE